MKINKSLLFVIYSYAFSMFHLCCFFPWFVFVYMDFLHNCLMKSGFAPCDPSEMWTAYFKNKDQTIKLEKIYEIKLIVKNDDNADFKEIIPTCE